VQIHSHQSHRHGPPSPAGWCHRQADATIAPGGPFS
jgi:hypothetical protein